MDDLGMRRSEPENDAPVRSTEDKILDVIILCGLAAGIWVAMLQTLFAGGSNWRLYVFPVGTRIIWFVTVFAALFLPAIALWRAWRKQPTGARLFLGALLWIGNVFCVILVI